MKIETRRNFTPIVITIETAEEASDFYNIFNHGSILDSLKAEVNYHGIADVCSKYKSDFYEFNSSLQNGITGRL